MGRREYLCGNRSDGPLATSVATLALSGAERERQRRERGFVMLLVTGLTVLAVAVHGYHPYSEDGGLYMAGIKHLVDPGMYPHGTEFVTEHLRFSIFAPVVAGLVRGSHLNVEAVLLAVQVASFWVTLFATWRLAARCFASREARCGAVALLATWMTLPVAGTALMLLDRYVTARSISTPCALLALEGALAFLLPEDETWARRVRGLALCYGALAVAMMVHPLMAADAMGCVLVLCCVSASTRRVQAWGTLGLCAAAVGVAATLWKLAPSDSEIYRRAAVSRYYWFLSEWQWYELVGLAAPLLILAVVAFGGRRKGDGARVALARMAVACGLTAVMVAALFARVESVNYLVARLQPLRVFQLVYVVMILMVGAVAAEKVLRRRPVRWVVALAALCGVMLFVERQTFPASAHMELQGAVRTIAPQNAWEQAFVWIRQNTPKDALFAMDADYIARPGEDAQCFRAIAERSVLPDYSKDGGEASITPELARAWAEGQAAQKGLNTETDAERIAALRPLGVSWVVLDQSVGTAFSCEFANGAVKVCRLP